MAGPGSYNPLTQLSREKGLISTDEVRRKVKETKEFLGTKDRAS
jgi:hypothetical protein